MPRYIYQCEECEVLFQTVHSIKEKLTDCEECAAVDSLKRVLSIPYVFHKDKQAGQLVKQHIKEAKKEIQEEKEHLRKATHK